MPIYQGFLDRDDEVIGFAKLPLILPAKDDGKKAVLMRNSFSETATHACNRVLEIVDMGILKDAFDEAQLRAMVARSDQMAIGQPDRPMEQILTDGTMDSAQQEHSFEPWMVLRYVVGSERKACRGLMREGYEAFYAAGRDIKPHPTRHIPWRKRSKVRGLLLEDVRNPYPGYMFVRRMFFGTVSPLNLWSLPGVIGICMIGEAIATCPDYRIELMRIAEDSGDYDRWHPSIDWRTLRQSDVVQTEAAKERCKGKPRVVGRVDKNRSVIHFVEEFGRITRVVVESEPLHQPDVPASPL